MSTKFFTDFADEQGTLSKVFFGVLLATLLFVVVGEYASLSIYETGEQYFFGVIWVAYIFVVAPPVHRLAHKGHSKVLTVVVWSCVSLVVTMVMFYIAYYTTTKNLAIDPAAPLKNGISPTIIETKLGTIRAQANLLLTIPPVILGVWVAMTGLYANHQTSKKNQRTSNTFALVIQTRTSTIYTDAQRAKQMVYPADSKLSSNDRSFFPAKRMSEIPKLKFECERLKTTIVSCADAKELQKLQSEFAKNEQIYLKLEAMQGIRYLLNFYEFLAMAVRSGDLDEELLIGTIRPIIVSLYNDAREYRECLRKGYDLHAPTKENAQAVLRMDGQAKVFENLDWLVVGEKGRVGWGA